MTAHLHATERKSLMRNKYTTNSGLIMVLRACVYTLALSPSHALDPSKISYYHTSSKNSGPSNYSAPFTEW